MMSTPPTEGREKTRRRRALVRAGIGLLAVVAVSLGLAAFYSTHGHGAGPQIQGGLTGAFIYAAQDDGTIHVYDINSAHRLVKVIRVFDCCADVRGAAAAAPTHRFYVMYNKGNEGHLAAVDLLNDQILWDRVEHSPGVDRGDVTPNGKTLYLPTWEGDPNTPYELVIDALTGDAVGRIALPPQSHDTVVSLDGSRVFMETKSATSAMYVADTTTNRIVQTVGGYCCTGVLAPYSINGKGTLLVNDVYGYTGFQVADVTSGQVIASAPFPEADATGGHGIAWTPNEREVWVNDGTEPYVHVFAMPAMPGLATPPVETRLVQVSNTPHWLTFSIDGRYAYVAGRKGMSDPTDVIDTRTYQRIGTLGPSEDLLEVDAAHGTVIRVGNQFGVGRVTTGR